MVNSIKKGAADANVIKNNQSESKSLSKVNSKQVLHKSRNPQLGTFFRSATIEGPTSMQYSRKLFTRADKIAVNSFLKAK